MHDEQPPQPMRRAIFLDRDGTLNEEVGYLRTLADLRFCAGAVEAVRRINEADWLAIVLTNQSGVARGLFPEAFVDEVHAEMQRRLQRAGARLDAFYACPHLPLEHVEVSAALRHYRIECGCRKPQPGLVVQAAHDFKIDIARSFVIGDRYRDVEMGHNAGAQSVLVLTGYGRAEFAQHTHWPRQPELIAANLLEAVQAILNAEDDCLKSAIRNPQSASETCAF